MSKLYYKIVYNFTSHTCTIHNYIDLLKSIYNNNDELFARHVHINKQQ